MCQLNPNYNGDSLEGQVCGWPAMWHPIRPIRTLRWKCDAAAPVHQPVGRSSNDPVSSFACIPARRDPLNGQISNSPTNPVAQEERKMNKENSFKKIPNSLDENRREEFIKKEDS